MSSVNKIILVGNVGSDPDFKDFDNGGCVCNISLATTEKWTNKKGEKVEETEWHKVKFGIASQAKAIRDHVKKGHKLYVEGSSKTRKYEQDGQTKYITEVKATSFQFLTPKGSGGANAATPNSNASTPEVTEDLPF